MTFAYQLADISSCTIVKDVRVDSDPSLEGVYDDVVNIKQEPTLLESGLKATPESASKANVKQEILSTAAMEHEPILISDDESVDRNIIARSINVQTEEVNNLMDRTEPEGSWDLQEKTMVSLLQFSISEM